MDGMLFVKCSSFHLLFIFIRFIRFLISLFCCCCCCCFLFVVVVVVVFFVFFCFVLFLRVNFGFSGVSALSLGGSVSRLGKEILKRKTKLYTMKLEEQRGAITAPKGWTAVHSLYVDSLLGYLQPVGGGGGGTINLILQPGKRTFSSREEYARHVSVLISDSIFAEVHFPFGPPAAADASRAGEPPSVSTDSHSRTHLHGTAPRGPWHTPLQGGSRKNIVSLLSSAPHRRQRGGDESIAHLLVQASPTTTAPLPPPETEDVAERRRRTKLFLRLVLHSPGEQLWRDVVMSALRLGTLRSHHLEQLLRDVLAPTADPASAEAAAAAVGSGRQLADETGPLPATPTARLHRLVEVIQFVYEQQQELRVEKEQHSADVDPAPKSVATKEAIPPQLVTQRLLIQLLVRLLRSAANHYEALLDLQAPRSLPSVPPSSASPLPCYYTYRGVWSFLAWMERHDLHIGSETVLETLRGAVDLDTAEEQAAHAAAARAPVQLANPPPGATSAVHLQRHMNRLAYLDREAVWRKRQQLESGKGGQKKFSLSLSLSHFGSLNFLHVSEQPYRTGTERDMRNHEGGGGPPSHMRERGAQGAAWCGSSRVLIIIILFLFLEQANATVFWCSRCTSVLSCVVCVSSANGFLLLTRSLVLFFVLPDEVLTSVHSAPQTHRHKQADGVTLTSSTIAQLGSVSTLCPRIYIFIIVIIIIYYSLTSCFSEPQTVEAQACVVSVKQPSLVSSSAGGLLYSSPGDLFLSPSFSASGKEDRRSARVCGGREESYPTPKREKKKNKKMVNSLVIVFASIIGVLALFAFAILGYVVYLIYRRRRAVHSALERRRLRLVSEQEEEQEAWRRQRLRQVVVLLLQKGLVEEGIPIGFQLPGGHREVHARRDLSRLHRNRADRLRENLCREMDETLDPRIRSVLQTPLHLLLEGGRPPEAAQGPDVLQLLLLDREDFTRQQQLASSPSDLSSEESGSDSLEAPPLPPLRSTTAGPRPSQPPTTAEGSGVASPPPPEASAPPPPRRRHHHHEDSASEDSLTHFLYGVTTRPLPEVMEEDYHASRLTRQQTSMSADDVAPLPTSLHSSQVNAQRTSQQENRGPSMTTAIPLSQPHTSLAPTPPPQASSSLFSLLRSNHSPNTNRPPPHPNALQGSSAENPLPIASGQQQQTTQHTNTPPAPSHLLTDISEIPDTEAKDIRRILRSRRSKKHPAIPAEQLYGPGVPYMSNPDNHLLQVQLRREQRQRKKISIEMDLPQEIQSPSSPLMRFLSPIAFPSAAAQKRKSGHPTSSSRASRSPTAQAGGLAFPTTSSGLPSSPNRRRSSMTRHVPGSPHGVDDCGVNSPIAPREFSSTSNSSSGRRYTHDPGNRVKNEGGGGTGKQRKGFSPPFPSLGKNGTQKRYKRKIGKQTKKRERVCVCYAYVTCSRVIPVYFFSLVSFTMMMMIIVWSDETLLFILFLVLTTRHLTREIPQEKNSETGSKKDPYTLLIISSHTRTSARERLSLCCCWWYPPYVCGVRSLLLVGSYPSLFLSYCFGLVGLLLLLLLLFVIHILTFLSVQVYNWGVCHASSLYRCCCCLCPSTDRTTDWRSNQIIKVYRRPTFKVGGAIVHTPYYYHYLLSFVLGIVTIVCTVVETPTHRIPGDSYIYRSASSWIIYLVPVYSPTLFFFLIYSLLLLFVVVVFVVVGCLLSLFSQVDRRQQAGIYLKIYPYSIVLVEHGTNTETTPLNRVAISKKKRITKIRSVRAVLGIPCLCFLFHRDIQDRFKVSYYILIVVLHPMHQESVGPACGMTAPHDYHHEAIHRLLDLGFIIQWSIESAASFPPSAAVSTPNTSTNGPSGGDTVAADPHSSSPPSEGVVRCAKECPLCLRRAEEEGSSGRRRRGGKGRHSGTHSAKQQPRGVGGVVKRSGAFGAAAAAAAPAPNPHPHPHQRGGHRLSAVDDDVCSDDEMREEGLAAVMAYEKTFASASRSRIVQYGARRVSENCLRYATFLGLHSAMESFRMIAVLPEVGSISVSDPGSADPDTHATLTLASTVQLPSVRKPPAAPNTSPISGGPPSSSTAPAGRTSTTTAGARGGPGYAYPTGPSRSFPCSSSHANSVPVVFFTYPSWRDMVEVEGGDKRLLLAVRRHPPPPAAPTLTTQHHVLLFQPRKELRPAMRAPPHLPGPLGEVCCCDVYLVLAPQYIHPSSNRRNGAGGEISEDDVEGPAMSVWGLCDAASHLHASAAGGSGSARTSTARLRAVSELVPVGREEGSPHNSRSGSGAPPVPQEPNALPPSRPAVEEGDEEEDARLELDARQANNSCSRSDSSSHLNRSTIDFDGLLIRNPAAQRPRPPPPPRRTNLSTMLPPADNEGTGKGSTPNLPAPNAHRTYNIHALASGSSLNTEEKGQGQLPASPSTPSQQEGDPQVVLDRSACSPSPPPAPHQRQAAMSRLSQQMELFCIADSLDGYFRLGAAFGWIYGWQLCYSSLGPPVTSIPWLRLFNPSAYQASRAFRLCVVLHPSLVRATGFPALGVLPGPLTALVFSKGVWWIYFRIEERFGYEDEHHVSGEEIKKYNLPRRTSVRPPLTSAMVRYFVVVVLSGGGSYILDLFVSLYFFPLLLLAFFWFLRNDHWGVISGSSRLSSQNPLSKYIPDTSSILFFLSMTTFEKVKTVDHEQYHQCPCYAHDTALPDYFHDVSVPKTLQGHYARKGGCPCPAADCWSAGYGLSRFCPQKSLPPHVKGTTKMSYREKDGPHPVYVQSGPDFPRDPVTGVRTTFPNRRNYGGTVADRGPTCLTTAAQCVKGKSIRAEKKEQRNQDRKNFLKAVLRDEMLAHLDAQEQRDALESHLGLLGANHVVDFSAERGAHALTGADPRRGLERGPNEFPTVADQYSEVMDELRFTADQPVGSKYNIIRLHYLVEEQDRINKLRYHDKVQQRTLSRNYSSSESNEYVVLFEMKDAGLERVNSMAAARSLHLLLSIHTLHRDITVANHWYSVPYFLASLGSHAFILSVAVRLSTPHYRSDFCTASSTHHNETHIQLKIII
eukprot:gene1615-985_t